jgi:hypothetical protein
MPCSHAGMCAILAAEGHCPLCGEAASASEVVPLREPLLAHNATRSGSHSGIVDHSAGNGSTTAAALLSGVLAPLQQPQSAGLRELAQA